jgi:hypothetical protein
MVQADRDRIAEMNQKRPATVKQPTFINLANLPFTSSRTIPMTGATSSKTNSNHNCGSRRPWPNPTLRSSVKLNHAKQPFVSKTHTARETRALSTSQVERTSDATSISRKAIVSRNATLCAINRETYNSRETVFSNSGFQP